MKRIGITAFLALQLAAQNAVLRQGTSPSGDVDFSNANTTKPVRTGATLPGACATNELFFLTNVGLHQCVKGKFAPLGNGGTWGTVGGAIAAQTDLWNTLQTKQPLLNGTQAQYVRGDGSFGSLAPSATTDTTIASNITQGTLPPAVLPNPTTSTIGGLYAAQATAHQWLSYVDANGQQHFARPDASDLTATVPGGVQRTQAARNADTVTVKDFGAAGDGVTDDTSAIVTALSSVAYGKVVVPPGTYLVSSTLTIGSSQELDCQGATLAFSGAHGVTMTGSKARLTNCGLTASTTGDRWVWTGLTLSNCNQCELTRIAIYQPETGVHVVNSVNNRGSIDIWNYKTAGVFFDASGASGANGNTFTANEITGSSVPGSIGIHNQGTANTIIGPEISYADIAIKNESTSLDLRGVYVEGNLSTSVWATSGSQMSIQGNVTSTPSIIETGAIVDTPGKGYSQFGNQPNSQISMSGLSAYYAMQEGTGSLLHDLSGNGRDATIIGSYSWVAGPYGNSVNLPGAAGGANYVNIPVSAVQYNAPYTVAMLVRPSAVVNGQYSFLLKLRNASASTYFGVVADTMLLKLTTNLDSFNLNGEIFATGKWMWLFASYDPNAGTVTDINPAVPPSVLSHAMVNPFSSVLTSITAQSDTVGNDLEIAQIAIWQRLLNPEEARAWITSSSLPGQPPILTGDVSGSFSSTVTTVKGINGTILSGLGTGILKNTTGTGVPSVAVAGTDYAPPTSGTGVLKGDGAGGFTAATASDISKLATFTAVPPYLRYMGDGSDGAINCSGNLSGIKYATTFTVASGNTCTANVLDNPLTVYATGACTIAGAINARGVDGGVSLIADAGGAGGGGGGGAAAGATGTGSQFVNGVAGVSAGTGGALGGNAGGNGAALGVASQRIEWTLARGYFLGGGKGGQGGSSGSAGGNGGQGVVLVCGSVNFTGAIDVSGAPGGASTGNSIGAGGGGGGGYVWLVGRDSVVSTGTITVAGGAGGSCGAYTTCGVGGTGGAGWSKVVQMQ